MGPRPVRSPCREEACFSPSACFPTFARDASEWQRRVRRLVWAADMPQPIVHFNVFAGDRWIGEVDFAFPELKICIPAHSLLHHTKAKRFYRDQEQTSELVAAGWHPLPTTKRDVLRHPLRFIERLRQTRVLAEGRVAREGPGEGRPAPY